MEYPGLLPLGEYARFDVGGLVAGALLEHVAAVGDHGWSSLPAAAWGRRRAVVVGAGAYPSCVGAGWWSWLSVFGLVVFGFGAAVAGGGLDAGGPPFASAPQGGGVLLVELVGDCLQGHAGPAHGLDALF